MADRGGVDLEVARAPQFGFRATSWPLGGFGVAMVLMGAAVPFYAPALWKVAVMFAGVGAATVALAGLVWHKTGKRGPVLVIRADSIGLPQMAAGKAPAPTRLRWHEVESVALTGPENAPQTLVLVLTADASRQRGGAVPTIAGEQPRAANRIRLSLTLDGLSETPLRIGSAVAKAAEAAGLTRGAQRTGMAQPRPDGPKGPHQDWFWPERP